MPTSIFNNSADYSGSTLALGAIMFAFQIYGDFSGYSDIAIGSSRLFGFDLMRNFAFPYFSRDVAEFWRRWHISLSTWFRDYLYVPLGGSRGGMGNKAAQHLHHLSGERVLAWGQLDLYRMGIAACPVLRAIAAHLAQQEQPCPCGHGQSSAVIEGADADAHHLRTGDAGMDFLQG
jgi:hypothetical protein